MNPHPHYSRFLVPFLIYFSIFVSGCGKPESLVHRRSQFMMGTLVEITIFEKDENKAELAIQNAFNEIQRLEGLMSTHIPGSEVSKINQAAGLQPVPVSPEVFEVIERALYWARKTDGALDISVGPVQELWHFANDHPSLPDKTAIKKKLSKVGYDKRRIQV